jgi:threonine/homoserine/homoserine lactone efflux protein
MGQAIKPQYHTHSHTSFWLPKRTSHWGHLCYDTPQVFSYIFSIQDFVMTDLARYLPGIGLSYVAFLLGVASPGPNVLAVMGTSMAVGRKAGTALALGVSFGSLTWALLTAFGLSVLLLTYAYALTAIKIFGGIYLLWLAYKAFKSAALRGGSAATSLAGPRRSKRGYAVRGYMIQMTNPKAALSWVAIISLGLPPAAPLWVTLIIVAGTFALSIMAHLAYAQVFSTLVMARAYGRARRCIQATLGDFFAFAGLKLLLS